MQNKGKTKLVSVDLNCYLKFEDFVGKQFLSVGQVKTLEGRINFATSPLVVPDEDDQCSYESELGGFQPYKIWVSLNGRDFQEIKDKDGNVLVKKEKVETTPNDDVVEEVMYFFQMYWHNAKATLAKPSYWRNFEANAQKFRTN